MKQAFYELAEKYNSGVWDLFHHYGRTENPLPNGEKAGLAQSRQKYISKVMAIKLLGDMMYKRHNR
ncbi:MAG: hypothetical protein ACOXZK_10540 [Bacteroidales bacterium]